MLTLFRPYECLFLPYLSKSTSFMWRHIKTMKNHSMNFLHLPRSIYLWITMQNNYIDNPHCPLAYSPCGYWAPLQPYSMALLWLPLISLTIFEGLHMHPQCVHISLNGPKQLQTENQTGMMTSLTTLHGDTWGKHYDGCPLANAYNYWNTWMTYYPQPNDYKLLITNMMAITLNVNNYGRLWTTFYVAPAKPKERPKWSI